jgi:hypothetical protein
MVNLDWLVKHGFLEILGLRVHVLEDQFFEDPAFVGGPFLEAGKQLIKQGFFS